MVALLLMITGGLAGVAGAMLGIGGGVILVPVLTLAFKVPLEDAVPTSLACVVAGSCGSAASYVERQLSDVRLALTLEVATVFGALVGGLSAGLLAPAVVAIIFGLFVLFTAVQTLFVRLPELAPEQDAAPVNYPLGVGGSFVAGGLSAILGVGGGPLKVPLMTLGMRVPFKVASATSNLMIGVTAAASLAAYAVRGHLKLPLVAPLVVGVLVGAAIGSRVMVRVPVPILKRVFAVLLLFVAGEMLWKGGYALWPSLWNR